MRSATGFFTLLISLAVLLSGCSDLKSHPVTWEDIAATIPSTPEYVGAVNVEFVTDSTFSSIWDKDDVTRLIAQALALDSVKPSHVLVVAMPKATFVTWPIPNPREVARKVSDWDEASLNNTVDARIKVEGKASLILSSTQVWVVNNVHGEKFVNQLLSAAMNTKAAHVVPYLRCITESPELVSAVIHYDNRYYSLTLHNDVGQMRLDVDAFDKTGDKIDIIEGLGRLPATRLDEISSLSPFVAVDVERGFMPELLQRIAMLAGQPELTAAAKEISPLFSDAEGPVTAVWNREDVNVRVPFVSEDAAYVAEHELKKRIHESHLHIGLSHHRDTLKFTVPLNDRQPSYDADRKTPKRHTQTDEPSAVAYIRFDLGFLDPAELYFELSPAHARLQIDYVPGSFNETKVTEFVKTLIFRTL